MWQEWRKFQFKVYQLHISPWYFLLNTTKNSISRTQIPFITYWKTFFKNLCVQVWRNIWQWHEIWNYCRNWLAIQYKRTLKSICFTSSLCVCDLQEELCKDNLNTLTRWLATKYIFCIVFKWLFRNDNFILMLQSSPLDLLCLVSDSIWVSQEKCYIWAFTKCILEKHLSLWQCSIFLLTLGILVFSFFISQLQCNNKNGMILFSVLAFI